MQWPLDEAFPLRAVLCADPDEARVADRKGEKAQGSVDRSQKRSADEFKKTPQDSDGQAAYMPS